MSWNVVGDKATGRTTHIHLARVGDLVFPVVNKSDQKTADAARGFAAEIEKVVLESKEHAPRDRIGGDPPPTSRSEDRRERSRRWKKETRAITPQAYRALCTQASRTRWRRNGKEVKMAWREKESKEPDRNGDDMSSDPSEPATSTSPRVRRTPAVG